MSQVKSHRTYLSKYHRRLGKRITNRCVTLFGDTDGLLSSLLDYYLHWEYWPPTSSYWLELTLLVPTVGKLDINIRTPTSTWHSTPINPLSHIITYKKSSSFSSERNKSKGEQWYFLLRSLITGLLGRRKRLKKKDVSPLTSLTPRRRKLGLTGPPSVATIVHMNKSVTEFDEGNHIRSWTFSWSRIISVSKFTPAFLSGCLTTM